MSKSNTALDRKMVKKHHKLTFGYRIFYSAILALVSLGLSFLLGSIAGTIQYNIPAFMYGSVVGMLYIYNAVAIVFQWLIAFLFPGIYHFKGLSDNSWNMLYKMDVNPSGLAMNKIRICIFSNLGIYLMGFVLSAGIGFVKSPGMPIPESSEIMTIILLAVCGIMALLTFIAPALAVGAASKGKLLIRLTIFAAGGLIAFFTYSCNYYICTQPSDIAASTSALISINPFGLLLVPALFAIIFPIITLSVASSRARNYNVEELDNELLVSLGVDENMLILEEGRNRYNVAISGPDVNDSDFDIEVPDMVPDRPQARPPRQEADMPRERMSSAPPRQQYDQAYDDAPPPMPPMREQNNMPPQNPGPRRDDMLMQQQQQNMGSGKREKGGKRGKKRRKDDYDEYDDY